MKRNILLLGIFFFLWIQVNAQQTVSASGGDASSVAGSVSYTVGQIDYAGIKDTSGSINQGVQQPYEFYILGINRNVNICLQTALFPNPAYSRVILRVGSYRSFQNLSYSLYNIEGKFLSAQKIAANETTIPLEQLPSGTYLLKVVDATDELKVFKVIKNQ